MNEGIPKDIEPTPRPDGEGLSAASGSVSFSGDMVLMVRFQAPGGEWYEDNVVIKKGFLMSNEDCINAMKRELPMLRLACVRTLEELKIPVCRE